MTVLRTQMLQISEVIFWAETILMLTARKRAVMNVMIIRKNDLCCLLFVTTADVV